MMYEDVYKELLAIGRKHEFRPDVPLEAEDFFRDLVSRYNGPGEMLSTWLEEQAIKYYRSLVKPPEWLQDPEWPVFQGKPMLFVGQVDLPEGSTPLLNHSASFFIFWDYESGVTKVVVQAD
jgi:hypothetical protein